MNRIKEVKTYGKKEKRVIIEKKQEMSSKEMLLAYIFKVKPKERLEEQNKKKDLLVDAANENRRLLSPEAVLSSKNEDCFNQQNGKSYNDEDVLVNRNVREIFEQDEADKEPLIKQQISESYDYGSDDEVDENTPFNKNLVNADTPNTGKKSFIQEIFKVLTGSNNKKYSSTIQQVFGQDENISLKDFTLFENDLKETREETVHAEIYKEIDLLPQKNDIESLENSISSLKIEPKLQLSDLLHICDQTEPLNFTDFLLRRWSKNRKGKKIGEASFSEVFELPISYKDYEECVVKVIPIADEEDEVNGLQITSFKNIFQEFMVQKGINNADCNNPGFVEVFDIKIVCGSYPKKLLNLWDRYKKSSEHNAINNRPEFDDKQLYALILMANGGDSLEEVLVDNYNQIASVFKQVCFTISLAEEKFEFEHRDLHWGNILVQETDDEFINFGKKKILSNGIKCCIVDFSFSRFIDKNGSLFYRAYGDESYFTGEGDYQFEVYRMMRNELNGDWSSYNPKTNIFWVHYLATKLLEEDLVKSKKQNKSKNKVLKQLKELEKRILSYKSASDLVENDMYLKENGCD